MTLASRAPVIIVVGDDPVATRRTACLLADPDATILIGDAEQLMVRRERPELHVIGMDPQLVEIEPECPCCVQRLDLIIVLRQLTARNRIPAPIIVVADGDADVAAIVQTLLGDPDLRRRTFLDGVVVAVAAVAASTRVALSLPIGEGPMSSQHRAMADAIVVTDAERLTSAGQVDLRHELRSENPTAAVVITSDRSIGRDLCLGLRAFSPEGTAAQLRRCRSDAYVNRSGEEFVRLDVSGDLVLSQLEGWLDALHESVGAELLRIQGELAVAGEDNVWCVWGTRSTLEICEGRCWGADARVSRLVLVGRGLAHAELLASLQRSIGA